MADETIVDKAMAMLPGGRKRNSASDARKKQLAVVERKLATLARDVEKLAALIAADAGKALSGRGGGKKPTVPKAPARKPAKPKKTTTKTSATRAAAKRPTRAKKG
jgi:hypothetical protein